VLYALGLEDALKRVQVLPSKRVIRHWSSGETWNWFDLGAVTQQRYGTPHVMLHRGDLHGLLADAVRVLKPDAVKLGKRCVAISDMPDHTGVRFEDGETVRAACVIGADGIHSNVRQNLFENDKPVFTGYVAWRGLAPIEQLPSHVAQMLGTNWLGPQGHVLHYPVRRGEIMNFITFVQRDDWQVESWVAQGTKDELANDFRGWHDDVHAIIRNLDTPYKWPPALPNTLAIPSAPSHAMKTSAASAPPRWSASRTRTSARPSAQRSPTRAGSASKSRASGNRSACASGWSGSTPTTRRRWRSKPR